MIIDWSKAPEGATHWDTGLHGRTPGWMRQDGSTWYWWPVNGAKCERKWFVCRETYPSDIQGFVARPVAWTGEGLPPVGTVCEWHGPNSDGPNGWVYTESKVVAYTDDGLFVCMQAPSCWPVVQRIDNCEFRPIRTPEQIAADQRLHDIRNALTAIKAGQQQFPNDVVRGNIVAATVEAMIDAGYRKQVAP